MEIDKELLLNVKPEIVKWNEWSTINNQGYADEENFELMEYNIYEFMSDCKNWAEIEHGLILSSYQSGCVGNCEIFKTPNIMRKFHGAETEVEAVAGACLHILYKGLT